MRYAHLSSEERYQIYALRQAGHSLRAIGSLLGRSPATICREIRRNRGGRGYRPAKPIASLVREPSDPAADRA